MKLIRPGLLLLAVLAALTACQKPTADSAQPEVPASTPIVERDSYTRIKPEGWAIPPLPENRKLVPRINKVGDRQVKVFTSYNLFGMLRFKEPYDALGLTTWGRLESVTEFQTSDHKPYCYRLAAEHDWTNQNERTGALMVVTILDMDGDGIFETLSGHGGCATPDWVK